jgi:3-deoxy-D-arabino-heptulosonate 7-phosphate (DAHP) synthase
MPLELISTKPAKRESKPNPSVTPDFGSVYSVAEINAYIAIRDELLDEAEKLHTSTKIVSTALANDFVDGCLKPARSPYETQCLPESDAVRERKRCEAVRERLAELRSSAD